MFDYFSIIFEYPFGFRYYSIGFRYTISINSIFIHIFYCFGSDYVFGFRYWIKLPSSS